ncbi:hypothetical protein OH77DRAFT_948222 [Trametes cingulata]|nr:hypothetical protein OH77DRAFT_948222 [Trametes cingulata]
MHCPSALGPSGPPSLSSAMTTSSSATRTTTVQAASSSLQLHRIDSPEDEHVESVLALFNAIFPPDPSAKRGSLQTWRTKLSHPSSFILYLAPRTQPTKPVAFIFVTSRVYDSPLKSGAPEGLHIWLAGTSPECRAAGCLTRMVHELKNIETLTICTHPTRFPHMWNYLTRRGWIQEQVFPEGKVMFSRPDVL